jgi:hypothetical protein
MTCVTDRLTDYKATTEQFYAPSYSNTINGDRMLHILCFLHFAENRKEIDTNYD